MLRYLLAFCALCAVGTAQAAEERPSAMDSIASKHEIRCGYNIYSPYLRKDPNTGAFSGIFYDIMEEIGKNAGVKIIWAEEAGRADMLAGLNNGRYDVWCSGIWPNSTRAMAGAFSHSAFYSVITPWVRENDKRFKTIDDLRKYKAKITTVDGAMEAIIADTNFPELPRITLPQLSNYDTNLQNIITKKADVVFAEPSTIAEFLAKNPHTLRSLGASEALRTFGNTLAVRQGDVRTQEFLNAAIDEVVFSGAVDRILKKYETVPGSFLRVARPYDVPK